MPRATVRPCAVPMCAGTTLQRYCTAHAHLTTQRVAKRAFHYLYCAKWKRYSASRLRKHPLCVDPFSRHPSRVVAASVTDHIIPHKGDSALFWNKRNHQSLCASCHGYKSATEEGGRAHSAKRELPMSNDAASLAVFVK